MLRSSPSPRRVSGAPQPGPGEGGKAGGPGEQPSGSLTQLSAEAAGGGCPGSTLSPVGGRAEVRAVLGGERDRAPVRRPGLSLRGLRRAAGPSPGAELLAAPYRGVPCPGLRGCARGGSEGGEGDEVRGSRRQLMDPLPAASSLPLPGLCPSRRCQRGLLCVSQREAGGKTSS